jgi:hypothetical protein
MSYKFLAKNGPVIAFLVAVVVILISIIPIFGGLEAFDAIPEKQRAYSSEGGIFSTAIYLTVILFILAIAAAVLLSIFQVVVHPKAAVKGLIVFGVLVALMIVFYAMADAKGSGSLAETIERFGISDNTSRFIGAGLRLTLLLGVGSIVIAVLLEIRNFFKNQ